MNKPRYLERQAIGSCKIDRYNAGLGFQCDSRCNVIPGWIGNSSLLGPPVRDFPRWKNRNSAAFRQKLQRLADGPEIQTAAEYIHRKTSIMHLFDPPQQ
jgi:hypothetical protein